MIPFEKLFPYRNYGKEKSAVTFCLVLLITLPTWGQDNTPDTKNEENASEVPAEYESPQMTLRTFLESVESAKNNADNLQAWENAYKALELGTGTESSHQDIAVSLSDVLIGILPGNRSREDYLRWAPSKKELEEGDFTGITKYEVFPKNKRANLEGEYFQEVIDTAGEPPLPVVLEKTELGVWKFSQQTVDGIGKLDDWIEQRFQTTDLTRSDVSPGMRIRRSMPP